MPTAANGDSPAPVKGIPLMKSLAIHGFLLSVPTTLFSSTTCILMHEQYFTKCSDGSDPLMLVLLRGIYVLLFAQALGYFFASKYPGQIATVYSLIAAKSGFAAVLFLGAMSNVFSSFGLMLAMFDIGQAVAVAWLLHKGDLWNPKTPEFSKGKPIAPDGAAKKVEDKPAGKKE